MINLKLKLRPKRKRGKGKHLELLGEYYNTPKRRIHLYLCNLVRPIKWRRFIEQFNAVLNHEMCHWFLREHRINEKIEERLCEKMEVFKKDD